MSVLFKIVRDGGALPKRGTPSSGAFDIYAPEANFVPRGESKAIPLGIAHQPPQGFHGILIPRSGWAFKHGLRLAFSPCLIDCDYRGEIVAKMENTGPTMVMWEKGERILQIAYFPLYMDDAELVDELGETIRGEGGFGSTGK